ncbi:MAG: YgcG family protein [Burkholderiales bacterium]|nr:YgcG family protein [Burkholderiales bacterium]
MPLALIRWLKIAILFIVIALPAAALRAQSVQPVPALTGHVIDHTGTLTDAQRQALEAKLAALEQGKGSQVVVLMVPTTRPEDIASYANRVGNSWKIGRKGVGDGLLLVVAKDDHRVRIEVAKTLEGAIPDLAANRIIEDAITPAFRRGDFAGGLNAGVDQITALINGEPLPAPAPQRQTGSGAGDFQWTNLAIFLFFAVPVAGSVARSVFGRKLGALLTGGGVGVLALLATSSVLVAALAAALALLFVLLAGLAGGRGGFMGGGLGGFGGFGGGGFGGGGGGGFGSGGGGDFGGGGASGSW